MHSVVIAVTIAAAQFETSIKVLKENIVPQISKAPGFVKGYWTVNADKSNGWSIVMFKTKADAETALQAARSNPLPPGVSIMTSEVREVVAEA